MAIVDYHLGNLFSVKRACDNVGLHSVITSRSDEILGAAALILPGVGAFGEAMHNIGNLGLGDPIIQKVNSGTPIFGICLGFQLLLEESVEFGKYEGLRLIQGTVKRFPNEIDKRNIKVPQIGWNRINKSSNWEGSPLEIVKEGEFMYFVHSFYCEVSDITDMICRTNYEGINYCSGVFKNNIFATQFHPEKSGPEGLKIYANWSKQYDLL